MIVSTQVLGNFHCNSGMRINEVIVVLEDVANSFKTGVIVNGIRCKIFLQLLKSESINFERTFFLEVGHPLRNSVAVAPC